MSPVKGVVRRIDHLGRIVIPVEIRRVFGIVPGDELDISLDDNGSGIAVRKIESGCVFCGASDGLEEHHSKLVCAPCRTSLIAMNGTAR